MWWVSSPFRTSSGVWVDCADAHSCCIHYIYDFLLFFTVNWELINQGQADKLFALPVSLTRWSSSRSIFRATRWCTGLHLRGCRGASGPCSRCAHPEKTAPSCHSSARESRMNSKSAPSSTNSREQTAMSKLARRWKKVGGRVGWGGGWMHAAVRVSSL